MNTWHLHIEGQVQGVGFRPLVFTLARERQLTGWVNNSNDGVHIEFNALPVEAEAFYREILSSAPSIARITGHRLSRAEQKNFPNFRIVHSQNRGTTGLLLTPDIALCPDCREEIMAAGNRRFLYPFTTCTKCGPRFSILERVPYDRPTTTMHPFLPCAECKKEYEAPTDRRYYSQTNSCPACAIQLQLEELEQGGDHRPSEVIIDEVVRRWELGQIVAIKGIGGYLLTCDAANRRAAAELRRRKHRPRKPFAVLFPDLASMEAQLIVRSSEKREMQYPVAAILLLDLKQSVQPSKLAPEVAPGLRQIGAMLPYTPLYEILLQKFGRPIIATSGNISNSPIVFEDDKAHEDLAKLADLILGNNRTIAVPQDDSVIRYSTFKEHRIVIRRSRGLAPTYINPTLTWTDQSILAAGAHLKSTFALLHQKNTYISQYLGDLDNYESQQHFRHTVEHFSNLLDFVPDLVVADLHPEYPATHFAQALAEKHRIPIHQYQHHMAHFGAVLGENDLLHSESPVMGVIWDGTGLGDDHQIWGGEFFRYGQYAMQRFSHFDYFDHILGDKMAKEPRISALSACQGLSGMASDLEEKFTTIEWNLYQQLLAKQNQLQTSSVGRLFDAVAALLGIADRQSFEGQAAIQLEALATDYYRQHGLGQVRQSYLGDEMEAGPIPTKALLTELLADLHCGTERALVAARFHLTLITSIKAVAHRMKVRKIAFSGGVFQNGLLVDLAGHHLGEDFDLYFHRELPPNDENVSFGQMVCHQIQQYKKPIINTQQSQIHVFSNSR